MSRWNVKNIDLNILAASSEQKSEGKKHNIENNSNELYLSRWNVKNIDLNILA